MLIDAYMCQLTKNFLSYEVRQQTFLLGLGYKIFEKKVRCDNTQRHFSYSFGCNENLQ